MVKARTKYLFTIFLLNTRNVFMNLPFAAWETKWTYISADFSTWQYENTKGCSFSVKWLDMEAP